MPCCLIAILVLGVVFLSKQSLFCHVPFIALYLRCYEPKIRGFLSDCTPETENMYWKIDHLY